MRFNVGDKVTIYKIPLNIKGRTKTVKVGVTVVFF